MPSGKCINFNVSAAGWGQERRKMAKIFQGIIIFTPASSFIRVHESRVHVSTSKLKLYVWRDKSSPWLLHYTDMINEDNRDWQVETLLSSQPPYCILFLWPKLLPSEMLCKNTSICLGLSSSLKVSLDLSASWSHGVHLNQFTYEALDLKLQGGKFPSLGSCQPGSKS